MYRSNGSNNRPDNSDNSGNSGGLYYRVKIMPYEEAKAICRTKYPNILARDVSVPGLETCFGIEKSQWKDWFAGWVPASVSEDRKTICVYPLTAFHGYTLPCDFVEQAKPYDSAVMQKASPSVSHPEKQNRSWSGNDWRKMLKETDTI